MASKPRLTFAKRIVLGILFLAAGVFQLGLGFGWIESRPENVFAPLWIVALCGAIFAFAGLAIALDLSGEPGPSSWPRRAAAHGVFIAILLMFAVVAGWLAFGDGPRHATTESGMLGVSRSGEASEDEARLWGGASAIVLLLATAIVAVNAWRDLFGRPK